MKVSGGSLADPPGDAPGCLACGGAAAPSERAKTPGGVRRLDRKNHAMTNFDASTVLFCSSEASPYAKTGGLADVVEALPVALKALGCDVRIFMPLYRCVHEKVGELRKVAENIAIPVGVHTYHVHFWETATAAGIPVYFLEKDEFYDRRYLYGSPGRRDYEDNAERFITFSRAVERLCSSLNWFPSIFHLHDWQTALAAVYHHLFWRRAPAFMRSGTVFTIHNLAYQGLFPADCFSLTQLPPDAFSLHGFEFWGQCNFLKAGLVYSDFLTTVSPRYGGEIQSREFGYGLEGILRDRRDNLKGILNGIDVAVWNPETDPLIPARFGREDLSGKQACKKALLAELGFPPESVGKPLLAMISRLATQKGFDLLPRVMEDIMAQGVHMVILGTGDAEIERQLQELAGRHPAGLRLLGKFDEPLAHRIEAGADVFLMPSRYEPCGLNQMYSLRYGTVPVVHATGGLDDSVVDVVENPEAGTGFKFRGYDPRSFFDAVRRAIETCRNEGKWLELRRRAMAQDFSWDRSAREYMEVYGRVLGNLP